MKKGGYKLAETGVLSSVDVANMLNDWYVMMKKRNTRCDPAKRRDSSSV